MIKNGFQRSVEGNQTDIESTNTDMDNTNSCRDEKECCNINLEGSITKSSAEYVLKCHDLKA